MNFLHYNNQQHVLFISGMFAGSWVWERSYKNILGHHWLIEEPLMGISNKVDVLIEVIAQKLRDLPEPVTIVGNSLGGYLAMAMAEEVPEKVNQVLISGSAGFSKIDADIKDCLSKQLAEKLGNRLADLVCYDKTKATVEDRRRLANDTRSNLRNMLGLLRACKQIDATDLLKNISCPVKALWGEHDIIAPFEDAQNVLERFNVEYTIIKDCGHSPMHETPKEFAEWVNQCLLEQESLIAKAA